MWIYVLDRPFYPTVHTFDSEQQAKEYMALDVEREIGDRHDATAYVAEVRAVHKLKTNY